MAGWEGYLPFAHGVSLLRRGAPPGAPPSAHAVYLSQCHSRACTAAAALRRLGLLPCSGGAAGRALRVTVAGADRNEGAPDAAAVAAVFHALAAAAAEGGATSLRLLLQGPALPRTPPRPATFTVAAQPRRTCGSSSSDVSSSLSSSDDDEDSSSADSGVSASSSATSAHHAPPLPTVALRVAFAHGELCADVAAADVAADGDGDGDCPSAPPHLVVAYNAGVWGYAGWVASIVAATTTLRAPCLVTAYSREEAEDDEDALREAGLAFLWEAEPNPFASLHAWAPLNEVADVAGREARAENAWWLCVAPAEERDDVAAGAA